MLSIKSARELHKMLIVSPDSAVMADILVSDFAESHYPSVLLLVPKKVMWRRPHYVRPELGDICSLNYVYAEVLIAVQKTHDDT